MNSETRQVENHDIDPRAVQTARQGLFTMPFKRLKHSLMADDDIQQRLLSAVSTQQRLQKQDVRYTAYVTS